ELFALEENGQVAEIGRMEVHGALPVSIAVEKMAAMGLVAMHPHPPETHDHKAFVNPCHDALKPAGFSIGDGSAIVELTTRGHQRAADIIRLRRCCRSSSPGWRCARPADTRRCPRSACWR